MNVLINTSNLNKGGALQVAHSFLTEIKENMAHEFHVVLSSTLKEQINPQEYPENFTFYYYSIKTSVFKAITGIDDFLSNLENAINPDCIFTVFGPAYWSAKSKHVVGFANGWCYNPDSIAFKKLNFSKKFKVKVLTFLQNNRIKKEADLLIVETQDAKNKITKYLKIKSSKIHVVSNTTHAIFSSKNQPVFKLEERIKNEFRFLTVSANYPHKNLEIIKKIVPLLEAKNINVSFWVTIPDKEFNHVFAGFERWIKNIGPVDIKYVPSIYKQCDALFLPTLLETFTASYPESMIMGKPILTSDLSFARDICGNAAEYFNPIDVKDIANKIEKIVSDEKRREDLIKEGYKQLSKFETATSRAKRYLKICKSLAK